MNQSENCLFVNVWRAANTTSSHNLSVLVYIHGGSFNTGSGASRDIGNMVAWSSSPFIGVSINYRLGALGFLSSSVAARQQLLNLGLRDQILALQWVQKNIAAFGGNPAKVTLMGDSAGGHSVRFPFIEL
jgi:acetylcholinesterase